MLNLPDIFSSQCTNGKIAYVAYRLIKFSMTRMPMVFTYRSVYESGEAWKLLIVVGYLAIVADAIDCINHVRI